MRNRITIFLVCVLASLDLSCSGPKPEPAPAPLLDAHVPMSDLPDINGESLLAHIKALSSDAFQGRGPGTRGEDLAVSYITDQFQKMGLKPAGADGTYVQKVPLVGITTPGATLVLKRAGKAGRPGAAGPDEVHLKWKDDVVAWTKHVAEGAAIENSEMVFVGYGVVAPEFNWDDYKGVDLKGKTVVMLINDPPVPDPENDAALDPKTFGGAAMTYYGRWTYKFEMAAEKGAAGALIVHETEPASYDFGVVQSSWTGEQFDLVTPDKNMSRPAIEGWITLDQGKSLFRMGGQDFASLKKLAATRDFKPVALGVTASMTLRNTIRTIQSRNVVAKVEGTDPALKDEAVVYTAHWDHLGIGPAVNGDTIYNGAIDNASGVGGLLELARASTKLQPPPKRSMVFAAVTGEEKGLLGSEYYAANPSVPLPRTLADINLDSINVHGRTKDFTVIGYGASDLDDYVRDAAAEQGRIVHPDPEPEKGRYYRSDHFNFAKQGVPSIYPQAGMDFIGKPADYGRKLRDDYTAHDYHKPSDQVKADWNMDGAREDLKLLEAVGYRVAQASRYPDWKPGNEFKARREAMLNPANEVEQWRAKHEKDYTDEYVPLAGLFFLKEGSNTAGSAAASDVKLPARTPSSSGRFVYQNQRIRFEPAAGSPVTLKGKPVTAPIDLKTDGSDDYDELAIGDVTFWVHESGDRRAIRLRDPQSALAKSFKGFHWFPIDEHYRVVGKFIKDPKPHEIKVASLSGDLQTYTTEGVVEFALNGEQLRLRPMTTRPNRFFFIFRDGTSGKETYAAARFLYADLRPDGTTVLDFNEAYNPPCAFNEFTTCPLPLPENRLTTRILVGEKAYPH